MTDESFMNAGDELKDYHVVDGIAYTTAVGLFEVNEEPGVERMHVLSFICSEGRAHNFVLTQAAWEVLQREVTATEPV